MREPIRLAGTPMRKRCKFAAGTAGKASTGKAPSIRSM